LNRLNIFLGRKKITVIAVVLAVLILFSVFWYFKTSANNDSGDNMYMQIYTAATDIVSGSLITEDMLNAEKIPDEMYSEKYPADIEEILGKKVYTDLQKGEIISSDKLEGNAAQQNSYLKFSSCIPAGYRAVSIPVNYYGQHTLIGAGDKVDIISTYYNDSSGDFISTTVLQYKEIIRIGTGENSKDPDLLNTSEKNNGSNDSFFTGLFGEGGQNTANLLILTFYLTPEEAEKIMLSLQLGTLNIALCPG
jgi:Flp pilus assembly protein CpaB